MIRIIVGGKTLEELTEDERQTLGTAVLQKLADSK